MDWLPALLKHLSLARSLIVALFLTCLTLHFGPKLAPSYFNSVPENWSTAIVATGILTGFLVLYWGGMSSLGVIKRLWRFGSTRSRSLLLSGDEKTLMRAMGEYPREAFNLNHIDYQRFGVSELEVLAVVDGLKKKGLVFINPFAPELISLTEFGRYKTLKIRRKSPKK